MKKNILWTMAIALGVFATACVEDDNPDISEHPWNYKLTPVNVGKVPTGILLYNPSGWWNNAQIRQRLEQPYDPETGKYGPEIKVSAGDYEFWGTNRDYHEEYAENIGKIVENVKKAKIDYIITPQIGIDLNKEYPNNVGGSDTVFIHMLSGKADTLGWKNDGSMKYAIRFNAQNVADRLGVKDNNSCIEDVADWEYTEQKNGIVSTKKVPARQVFIDFVRRLSWYFADPTYYRFNGRPVMVWDGAYQLYSRDPRKLYDDVREAVRNTIGEDIYIIVRQRQWTPPARWQMFFIDGHADAVCPEKLTNLENGIGWDRFDLHNILIDQHMMVNREYYANYGINYIPSVSSGFSYYVQDGRWDYPIIRQDPQDFRERCWSAKKQLGAQPMVIVDAYNEWNFCNAVEPTEDPEEGRGHGWGDTYLNIIAEEFGN